MARTVRANVRRGFSHGSRNRFSSGFSYEKPFANTSGSTNLGVSSFPTNSSNSTRKTGGSRYGKRCAKSYRKVRRGNDERKNPRTSPGIFIFGNVIAILCFFRVFSVFHFSHRFFIDYVDADSKPSKLVSEFRFVGKHCRPPNLRVRGSFYENGVNSFMEIGFRMRKFRLSFNEFAKERIAECLFFRHVHIREGFERFRSKVSSFLVPKPFLRERLFDVFVAFRIRVSASDDPESQGCDNAKPLRRYFFGEFQSLQNPFRTRKPRTRPLQYVSKTRDVPHRLNHAPRTFEEEFPDFPRAGGIQKQNSVKR